MGLAPRSSPVMERGVNLHAMCEQYFKNEEIIAKTEEQHNFFHEKVRNQLEKLNKTKIEQVEASFTAPLTEKIPAKGIMDLLYGGCIYDWKFTNGPWNDKKFEAYKQNQALLYLYLYSHNKGTKPLNVTYWIFPQEGKFQEFVIPYNEKEIKEALQVYKAVCLELEECNIKMHFPPSPSFFNCKYCDYNDICPMSETLVKPKLEIPTFKKGWGKY